MTLSEISNSRIFNQKIKATELKSPAEIVGWMGAIQAQDLSMAKWAIGVRLLNATADEIDVALNKGEIIRTHVMRPTWHFISAQDIYWMLELTAVKIKSSMKSRDRDLELSEAIYIKCNGILEKLLINGLNLTRDELAKEFDNAKIKTDNNRLSHLLLRAELDGIVCSGQIRGNKQTYALLHHRIPCIKVLSREESLAELAKRYFTSHGPATLFDFVWWSGLSVKEARQGMESVKSIFFSETIGSEKYWFTNLFSVPKSDKSGLHLLPAFDEFLISYKDRSASLSLLDHKKAVSENGIFRPVIVLNGQVAGLWKRTIKENIVVIEIGLFQPHNAATKNVIEKAALAVGQFWSKETKISYNYPAI